MLEASLLIGLYSLFFAFAWIQAIKVRKVTDILPSTSWYGSMVIPYIFVILPFAHSDAVPLQAIGFCIIGFALLAGDYASMRQGVRWDNLKNEDNQQLHIKKSLRLKDNESNLLFYCNIAFICILLLGIAAHFTRIGWANIPLLSPLFQHEVSHALLGHMRDLFSREADLTIFEKYYYNFNAVVFGLPPLAYLLITKRFKSMIALFAICTFYLVASTAKMPFMIFFCTFAVMAIHIIYPKHKNQIFTYGIAAIVIFTIVGAGIRSNFPYWYAHEAMKGKEQGCEIYLDQTPKFCDLDATMADYYRLPFYLEITRPTPVRLFDYGTYRMLVTPVDVSYRWYQYFSNEHKQMGFASIIPHWRELGYIHPARQVANFALESRFPEEYKTAYAYGSIDADAYARGGMKGLFIIAFILFLVRICPAYLNAHHPFSEIYRLMIIALLVLLPPSSSLHAMLVAHGMLVICGILFAFWLFDKCLPYLIKTTQKADIAKLKPAPE